MDDNVLGLMARRSVLEENSYEVTSIGCPHEALTRLGVDSFDLLITDYRMEAMSGVELIGKVRGAGHELPAILLSGFAETLGLDRQNTGADAVIQKNANEIPHLLRTVRALLRGRKLPKSEGPPPSTGRRKKA
ncbi:MAG: response regulator [Bryobacteraceae bacterium]